MGPRNRLGALFLEASSEITKLMDGFYSNIEDGLFEKVYANEDRNEQQRIVELMREIRLRRSVLVRTFLQHIQKNTEDWILERGRSDSLEAQAQAEGIASRCSAHFVPLLQSISERIAHAADREPDREHFPISPERITYHFIMSCRSLSLDRDAVYVVEDLFDRFVLGRLGAVYGKMNSQLMEAGFLTVVERAKLSATSV